MPSRPLREASFYKSRKSARSDRAVGKVFSTSVRLAKAAAHPLRREDFNLMRRLWSRERVSVSDFGSGPWGWAG